MTVNEEKLDKPCCSKSLQEIDIENAKNKRTPESSDDKRRDKSKKKKDPLSIQMNQCKRLLHSLRTAKEHYEYSNLFYYPVDPIAYQCPDYYDIIKNPMDLNTMQEKMERGDYKTPEDFAADIRLIIDNTLTYNGPDHEIIPYVNKFKDVFETRFQKIITPKSRYCYMTPTESEITYRKSSRTLIYVPDDEETLVKEIVKTQKYLTKLYEKHQSILDQKGQDFNDSYEQQIEVPKTKKRTTKKELVKNPKKNAKQNAKVEKLQNKSDSIDQRSLSSCSDNEDNQIPMTFDEKRDMLIDINKLPGDKLDEISKIVRALDPDCYTEHDQNFEINFSECKVKTLRELQRVINEYLRPKPARAVPFPRKNKLEKNTKLVEELKIDLENQKKECETKLATVEDRLAGFLRKKAKSPELTAAVSSSTSSGSSSSSSSSSSLTSTSSSSSSGSAFKG
ncbi:bromodomain testis-specific protein-like [Chironomus tepperi]|uniref:bromodomain testis-specific protein-like n=1 Tax=Chironomus tepperi TaxID=113505 RepID=UPI00391F2F72